MEDVIRGTVVRIESKDYYVMNEKDQNIVRCSLKGKFKNDFKLKKDKLYLTDIAVVGDSVEFDLNSDGSGVIHTVHDRDNYLSRKAPRIKGAGYRGERLEQVIAANIDNFFIVSSIAEPAFNNKVIDRFIVSGESAGLNVLLIINKADLSEDSEIEAWQQLYEEIGYKVFITSVENNLGTADVKNEVTGKKSIFWGHSGVGKSSLLNSLFPGLDLQVGKISTFNDKGMHTTVTSTMIRADNDTYIIDTPGIREIEPYGIKKEDLSHYFIEFVPFLQNCRFNTCTHQHEPGCAVIEAVEEEQISVERYESYLRMLETIEEDINF